MTVEKIRRGGIRALEEVSGKNKVDPLRHAELGLFKIQAGMWKRVSAVSLPDIYTFAAGLELAKQDLITDRVSIRDFNFPLQRDASGESVFLLGNAANDGFLTSLVFLIQLDRQKKGKPLEEIEYRKSPSDELEIFKVKKISLDAAKEGIGIVARDMPRFKLQYASEHPQYPDTNFGTFVGNLHQELVQARVAQYNNQPSQHSEETDSDVDEQERQRIIEELLESPV
jgi:hypothetical protein